MANVDRRENLPLPTERFISRIEALYGEVRSWLRGTGLTTQRHQVMISEYQIPPYEAPSLSIHSPDGKELASLKPVGMRILGAGARVDLVGAYGSRGIVYLSLGAPP